MNQTEIASITLCKYENYHVETLLICANANVSSSETYIHQGLLVFLRLFPCSLMLPCNISLQESLMEVTISSVVVAFSVQWEIRTATAMPASFVPRVLLVCYNINI